MERWYLKTLPNKKQVFDFEAVANTGYPVNILISERGQRGKTYGQKEYQYNEAINHIGERRKQCLWLRSLSDDARREASKFLGDIPANMEQDIDYLEAKVEKTGGEVVHQDYGTIFRFSNVSTTRGLKGTRETFREVVWDEFNESTKTFRHQLIENWTNILSSANNQIDGKSLRIWLFGNNKGLNHPLLASLGITYISGEVMRINAPNGDKLIQLIVPIYDGAEIEEMKKEKEHDPLFQLNMMLGTADHIYFNKTMLDDINNIYRYVEVPLTQLKPTLAKLRGGKYLRQDMTLYLNGEYLNLYWIPDENRRNPMSRFHVVHLGSYKNYLKRLGVDINVEDMISKGANGDKLIYTTKVANVKEGIQIAQARWRQLRLDEVANQVWSYENEVSRSLFLEALTYVNQ